MQKNNSIHTDLKAVCNSAAKKLAVLALVAAVGNTGLAGSNCKFTASALFLDSDNNKQLRKLESSVHQILHSGDLDAIKKEAPADPTATQCYPLGQEIESVHWGPRYFSIHDLAALKSLTHKLVRITRAYTNLDEATSYLSDVERFASEKHESKDYELHRILRNICSMGNILRGDYRLDNVFSIEITDKQIKDLDLQAGH